MDDSAIATESAKVADGKRDLPQGHNCRRVHISLPQRYLKELQRRDELGRSEQVRRALDLAFGWAKAN